jgi:epoxyqueuosine reductase
MALARAIKEEAQALGFDAVGIARVADSPSGEASDLLARLTAWLRRGFHGTMAWMGRAPERRADPRLVLPGCRSIISVGVNYLTDHRADERPGHGRIARYAWGRDYHKVLGNRLHQLEGRIRALAPDAVTRAYVDTGPVMEKAWAERAGLGWIGKHSNLVSAQYGSWLLLGEVLTTLVLEADEPGSDLCGSCTLCLQACPTDAIVEPYVVDATRCISYLTIELRDDQAGVSHELEGRLGNKIFGCDDCLDVCPFNLRAIPTTEPAFQPTATALAPRLTELVQISEEAFVSEFRDSPIRRTRHRGFLRNVRLALENHRSSSSLRQE